MWLFKKDNWGLWFVVSLLFSTVVIYALSFNRYGLIVENDSTIYIRGALNLHEGKGFTLAGKYISHFPVGLSYVYHMLMSLFPGTIFSVAFGLHLVLLLVAGFGFIYLMRQLQLHSLVQSITLFAFLFSVPIAETSLRMLSDFPFMCMILLSSLLLLRHIKAPESMSCLWVIGLLLGITYLVRFAALGFLGAFLLIPFVLWPTQFKQNIKKALALFIPFLVILLSNKAYVAWKYQTVSVDRVLAWHPMHGSTLMNFPSTLFSWVLNYNNLSQHTTFVVGILLVGIVLALWGVKKKNFFIEQTVTSPSMYKKQVMRAFAVICLSYCLFLIVSISLFDAWTPINTRLLSPLAVYVFLGLGLLLQGVYDQSKYPLLSISLSAALAVLMSLSTIKLIVQARTRIPLGYNAPYWTTTGQEIANNRDGTWLTPQCAVYSNGIAFFAMQNDRMVMDLPYRFSPITQENNTQFQNELNTMLLAIKKGAARLVFFSNLPAPPFKIQEADLLTNFADSTQFEIHAFNQGFVVQGK